MSKTTTTALAAWVTDTCPDWCTLTHTVEQQWGDDSESHSRDFGDDELTVGVVIGSDGQVRKWDATVEAFDASDPDELDDAAEVLRQAAQWVRSSVVPLFGSTAAPADSTGSGAIEWVSPTQMRITDLSLSAHEVEGLQADLTASAWARRAEILARREGEGLTR